MATVSDPTAETDKPDEGSTNDGHRLTSFQGQLLRAVATLQSSRRKEPISGRDIVEVIERDGWEGSHDTPYKNLRRLNELGLISMERNPLNMREKVFELTESGREEIKSKTHQWEIATDAVRQIEWDGTTHGGES